MKKYLNLLKLSFVNKIDYRQELILSLFIGVFIFAGQAIFWRAVYWDKSEINGFSYNEILLYFLFVRIISDILNSNVGHKISLSIQEGQISNYLVKPIKTRTWFMFEEIGEISLILIIKIVTYLSLFFLVFHQLELHDKNFLGFIISLCFSFIISFSIFSITGLIAFWTDNSTALHYGIRRGIFFLSGGLLPLAFFPNSIQNILDYLPFKYIFSLPVDILNSSIDTPAALRGILIQIGWALFLWIFTGFIFNKAVKNNQSVGI